MKRLLIGIGFLLLLGIVACLDWPDAKNGKETAMSGQGLGAGAPPAQSVSSRSAPGRAGPDKGSGKGQSGGPDSGEMSASQKTTGNLSFFERMQADLAARKSLPSQASINWHGVKDQNNGKVVMRPVQTGRHIAEATVLHEVSDTQVDDEEILSPPSPDDPDWKKLRWMESLMQDGMTPDEAAELRRLISQEKNPHMLQEYISTAAYALGSSEDLRVILDRSLDRSQPENIRIHALYLAKDLAMEKVQQALSDANETVRLHAEALLDEGRSGLDFRE